MLKTDDSLEEPVVLTPHCRMGNYSVSCYLFAYGVCYWYPVFSSFPLTPLRPTPRRKRASAGSLTRSNLFLSVVCILTFSYIAFVYPFVLILP